MQVVRDDIEAGSLASLDYDLDDGEPHLTARRGGRVEGDGVALGRGQDLGHDGTFLDDPERVVTLLDRLQLTVEEGRERLVGAGDVALQRHSQQLFDGGEGRPGVRVDARGRELPELLDLLEQLGVDRGSNALVLDDIGGTEGDGHAEGGEGRAPTSGS
jgi:hypothetical protein